MVTFARDGQSQNEDDTADEVAHLHRALQSQPAIEQAKGLLMAQHGCTPDEAFAMLMRASQRENRKLRDVARAMIDGSSSGAVDRRVLAADARDRAADARDQAAVIEFLKSLQALPPASTSRVLDEHLQPRPAPLSTATAIAAAACDRS